MSRIRTFIFGVYLSLTTLLVGGFGALALPFGLRRGARLVTRTWAQCALFGLKLICGVSHVIKGEKLVVDLKTGQSHFETSEVAEASGKKRVRMLINQGKKALDGMASGAATGAGSGSDP